MQEVITRVDEASRRAPEIVDGVYTAAAKKCREAYDVVDSSNDEVFQYELYDWYLTQGASERLLAVKSPYVVSYLQRKAKQSVQHADLLWRYWAQRERYHDAATVQLQLAKSEFQLTLDKRIEYLSKAKANAFTLTPGTDRLARQQLLHDVTEQLEIGTIQEELIPRLQRDPRINPARKEEVMARLNGRILGVTEVRKDKTNAFRGPNSLLTTYAFLRENLSYLTSMPTPPATSTYVS